MTGIVPPTSTFVPPRGFAFLDAMEHHGAGTTFRVERDATRFVCKRLSERAREDDGARRRLVAEGEILAALAGRGAPRLVASGEDANGPFVVMEQIALPTLASGVHATAMDRAALSLLETLANVHDAHDARGALRVVHADVSPSNVLVAIDGGSAKLLDFGLARWRESNDDAAPAFRGTLMYAAPEVARGDRFDARADLFALAASVLHVASGTSPRPSMSEPALLALAGDIPIVEWATTAAASLSPPIARALVECIAHAPDARPATARDALARAMRPA